jgi:putative salt-induced outer membrane protein
MIMRMHCMSPTIHAFSSVLSFAFLALGWAHAVSGAEVTVKGQQVEGSVIGFTAEGVEFEPAYGKGKIVILWTDVDTIQTDKEFVILYGEEKITTGKIWGLEGHELIVGESSQHTTRIPTDQILRSLPREQYDTSRLEALRLRYRAWHANLDLAFDYTDATTDTSAFAVGLEIQRKKKPTDLQFAAYYRVGTTQEQGEDRITNEHLALGKIRLNYDLSDRWFGFGSVSAEWNEIQRLKIRTDPTLGLGYRLVNAEKLVISGRMGAGYVYQEFFNGDTENYPTIVFGGELDAKLPRDATLSIRVEYLPSVVEWTENYLIRAGLDWTMPIVGLLAFKFAILDVYNNRPTPGTQPNSFTTTVGLSLRF